MEQEAILPGKILSRICTIAFAVYLIGKAQAWNENIEKERSMKSKKLIYAAKNANGTVRYGCIGQCCRDASGKGYIARVDKEVLKAESQEAFMARLNEKLGAQSAH